MFVHDIDGECECNRNYIQIWNWTAVFGKIVRVWNSMKFGVGAFFEYFVNFYSFYFRWKALIMISCHYLIVLNILLLKVTLI